MTQPFLPIPPVLLWCIINIYTENQHNPSFTHPKKSSGLHLGSEGSSFPLSTHCYELRALRSAHPLHVPPFGPWMLGCPPGWS